VLKTRLASIFIETELLVTVDDVSSIWTEKQKVLEIYDKIMEFNSLILVIRSS
jgi:hypothetical protein